MQFISRLEISFPGNGFQEGNGNRISVKEGNLRLVFPGIAGNGNPTLSDSLTPVLTARPLR